MHIAGDAGGAVEFRSHSRSIGKSYGAGTGKCAYYPIRRYLTNAVIIPIGYIEVPLRIAGYAGRQIELRRTARSIGQPGDAAACEGADLAGSCHFADAIV